MVLQSQTMESRNYSVLHPAAHPLHECATAEDFAASFREFTGYSVQQVIDRVISPTSARAVLLTGSIPLGMATNGSDVDLIVLVDSREAIVEKLLAGGVNTDQQLTFSSDSDLLRAGLFLNVMNGVTVEVAAVMTPGIARIHKRLRSRGPELTESEIMTLGRISTGWLLNQTEGYLESTGVALTDSAVDVYCGTRYFAYALIYRLKAGRALDLVDVPQSLHLARLSVEMAYLAYFASEGMPYLGPKWLAQLGHARTAAARLSRHPLLREGIPLLFPAVHTATDAVKSYLKDAEGFLHAMRHLIEQRTLFKIAFGACPQIASF